MLLEILQDFHFELMELMKNHEDHVKNFMDDGHKWLSKHDHVIKTLKAVMVDLKEHNQNVSIASLVGSSVSLAGCGGILLAPFTGGASLAVAAASLIGTTAGTITAVGAQAVGTGIQVKNISDVNNRINEFCQETLFFSSLICSVVETEKNIHTFIADNTHVIKFIQNKFPDVEVITQKQVNTCLKLIQENTASIHDYCLVIHFLCSNNFKLLRTFRRFNIESAAEIGRMSVNLVPVLIQTVNRLKDCMNILKACDGAVALQVARVTGKRLLIFASAVSDVYEIVSSAKNLIMKKDTSAVKSIKEIILELEVQGIAVKKFLYEHE